jgi:tetratricopeptide (TPR) repeat protein
MHSRKACTLLPEHIRRYLYNKCAEAVANKKYRRAIMLFERYRKRYVLPVHEKYRLGLLYDHLAMMHRGKIDRRAFNTYLRKAGDLYHAILKEDPSYFHALYGLGRIYNAKEDYKKGLQFQIRAYREMMKLPKKQRGALAIGRTYELIGDWDNAEQWYLKELRNAPRDDFGVTLNLFMFYKNRGQRERALRYAARVEKLIKSEYRKQIYNGLKMQNSRFVKYVKREVEKMRQKK